MTGEGGAEGPRRVTEAAGTAAPRRGVLGAAVATLGAAVFAPALAGSWIYDDRPLVAENVHVHSLSEWPRWLTHDFWDVSEEVRRYGARMIYWRPGVDASYALDWLWGHGSPVAFHATNLAWQAAACWLAFTTLRRWLDDTMLAFFAALLFALHPTKAESVAWIAGRTDVLCAVMMLIATAGIARRLRGQRSGWALELTATLLAYAMKEQAIALFAFAAVETWVFIGRPALDRATLARLARASAPQLAIAAAYLVARAIWMPIRPDEHTRLPLGAHLIEVLETIGRYAALVFVPHDLSVQQALMRAPGGRPAFDATYAAVGAAFAMALAILAVGARKRMPGVAVGVAFFAITIFPTSNVVPTDMTTMLSERFLYLPLLGLVFAGASYLSFHAPVRKLATAVAVACTLALGASSAAHASDFADEERFWARELALHPDSLEALRFHIQKEAAEKRFARALGYAARAQQVAAAQYPQTGYELDFIVQGVQFLLVTTPDRDERSLDAIDAFLSAVAEGTSPAAELVLPRVRLGLPLGRAILKRRIDKQRPRILALRAGIASRRANDESALALAREAHALCVGCFDVARTGALVAARASHYDIAYAMLDDVAHSSDESVVAETRALAIAAEQTGRAAMAAAGERQLQLRASELATLEAWGRAFRVLLPAKDEIEKAPGFALGFAELAWRAGEFGVAREVLGTVLPPAAIDETTRGWSRKMGWDDPPSERSLALPL